MSSHHLVVPVTPPSQRALSRLSNQSPHLENIDCSPETASKLKSLKRKARVLNEQPSPAKAKPFLSWRVRCVDSDLEYLQVSVQALKEASPDYFNDGEKSRSEQLAEAHGQERRCLEEKLFLLSQSKFLQEDLEDSTTSIEEAYMQELYTSWVLSSEKGSKEKSIKQTRLGRGDFKKQVIKYLDAEVAVEGNTDQKLRYCNILGAWIPSGFTKCAHIVPFSFEAKELGHMFGTEKAALESPRNGLVLASKIEEGFDNGWIAIVPDGSVSSTPTVWKVVVLNDAVLSNTVYTDITNSTSRQLWRWRDLHDKKLSFNNDNRPARRYLYFRYIMAWIHASRKGYKDFKVKLPPGRIWASPDKSDGYLRKSVLRLLDRKVGDEDLPEEMLEGGTFEDTLPATGNAVRDEVTGIYTVLRLRDHLSGKTVSAEEDEEEEGDD